MCSGYVAGHIVKSISEYTINFGRSVYRGEADSYYRYNTMSVESMHGESLARSTFYGFANYIRIDYGRSFFCLNRGGMGVGFGRARHRYYQEVY